MPSIFIWKSDVPNNSKKTLRIYSGSNWILEDNEYSSKSYIYNEQIVIPGFNDSVITFNIKNMPQDWVGSDLLEVTQVPYEFIKSDNYGILERIGDWMRFTTKNEIIYDLATLIDELVIIKKWINETHSKKNVESIKYKENYKQNQNNGQNGNQYKIDNNINITDIQNNFKKFLNQYTIPSNMILSNTIANTYKNTYNTINTNKNTNKNKYK